MLGDVERLMRCDLGTELLIVIATVLEARAFLAARGLLGEAEGFTGVGWPILVVGDGCKLVISGIGRANAAGATGWAIAKCDWVGKRVVSVGIAGVLPGGGLNLGDVVVAREAVFVEEGIFVDGGWRDVRDGLNFELCEGEWADGNRVRCDEVLNDEIAQAVGEGVVRRGVIATVATCSGTDEAAEEVVRRSQATAEGMEGAAVVATAKMLGCWATEVRVMSNTCGARSEQVWEMKNALAKLHLVLDALVD